MDHAIPPAVAVPDLRRAIAEASSRYAPLLRKYPSLKPWLVISSPVGQVPIEAALTTMILDFPHLFFDTAERKAAMDSARMLQQLEERRQGATPEKRARIESEIQTRKAIFDRLSHSLTVDGSCRFELRFRHLDYAAIRAIKRDPLVDPSRTLESPASIRIVLAAIEELASAPASHQSGPEITQ